MKLVRAKRKFPVGVRFNPTQVELVLHYLLRKVLGQPLEAGLVEEVDIYKFHPATLKALACFSEELNWYFFCPTQKKYGNGKRISRSTPTGFWKATGEDKPVLHGVVAVGYVKTLVFHEGKPPNGVRTDWVMKEYSLEDTLLKKALLEGAELGKDGKSAASVLCLIYYKDQLGARKGEQFGAAFTEIQWERIAGHGQISPAEMDEDDLVSADANITTVEQVHQSFAPAPGGANAASNSNGFAFSASPSRANPMAAHEIAPTSRDPVAGPYDDDEWWSDGFFDGFVDLTPADAITTQQLHSDANGDRATSIPNGVGFDATDIASSSRGPIGDPFSDLWCHDDHKNHPDDHQAIFYHLMEEEDYGQIHPSKKGRSRYD